MLTCCVHAQNIYTLTGQGRMDGAICEFTEDEKLSYLKRVQEAGVVNIEMECTAVASVCRKAGMKCGIVCITLVDRLNGDQEEVTPEQYQQYQTRPQKLVATFIRSRLNGVPPSNN